LPAAGELELKREARKERVKEIKKKRGGGVEEEPPTPPKPEPKPGVRLSSKEVFEIIAQRKAKAQAKAKVQQRQRATTRSMGRKAAAGL